MKKKTPEDFFEKYEIDEEGRIWTICRRAEKKYSNYLHVGSVAAHILVWEYFFGPIPKDNHIHHKDSDKMNNAPWNLACITRSQHVKAHYALKQAIRKIGKKRVQTLLQMDYQGIWTKKDLAKQFDLTLFIVKRITC